MLNFYPMMPLDFQLKTPIDAFVFDCDCTLSLIEGIEVLATENGVGERVRELTRYAMGEAGLSPDIYQERLSLVRPTRKQVITLAQQYFSARVPDIADLIRILQALGKAVYVVSAGVNPAVTLFAQMLDVPAECVYAVDLQFSDSGDYHDYDRESYPAQTEGKRLVAQKIKLQHARLAWIGDGMNDLVVKPDVARFIGYGGAAYREKIALNSDFYIKCRSIAPVLALGLTSEEASTLDAAHSDLLLKGQALIDTNNIEIRG